MLVLQIAGKKLWRIFAPSLKLPHRSQLFTPEAFRGQAPVAEIELQAGDLLYLPRGYLHATTTSDTFSAHVTIGITVYTWVDLVKQVLQSAIASEGLREALPPGFASRDDMKPILRQKMAEALEQLRADVDLDRLLESFTDRVLSSHVPRPEPFKANIRVVDLESTLATTSASSYKLTQEGPLVMLEFKGTRYQLPAPVELTIRSMSTRATFRASDLPDHLDSDGRLALIRHLHDIGFLSRVDGQGGN